MAIVHSITMGKAKGSLGNVTLRYCGGDTIASQKVLKGTQKIGTLSQVLRRVRFANLVNAFQALNAVGDGNGMAQSFPARPARTSNFNMFMSRNLGRIGVGDVALSREQAASGVIVPAPFLISEGDLSSISAIAVGDADPTAALPDIDFYLSLASGQIWLPAVANEQPAQLMARLKAKYGLMEGDVLTIFGMEWRAGDDAKFASLQIVIDSSADSLGLAWSEQMVGSASFWTAKLVNPVSGSGGASLAVVAGRRATGGYRVSTASFLETYALTAVTARYTSDAAKSAAAISYGYKDDPYLQDAGGVNP